MKTAFAVATLVAAENGRIARSGERGFKDLEDIIIKYWAENGLTWDHQQDARKYFAYGCHCILMGDRPLSDMGWGRPVDALDTKCKAYKDCQKCVREKHGDQCINEFVHYTWKWSSKSGGFECADEEGSCERELFECDIKFVHDLFNEREVYNNDYHMFYSTTGFDFEDKDQYCPSAGIPGEPQCCGGHDGPWYRINLNKQKCCERGQGGQVIKASDSC